MTDVTRILSAIEQGDPAAAEQLLPLVYDELRKLAAQKMAQEKPGQTLQATALVHEAYVRLVDVEQPQHWNSRGHFFSAAAEAMRRILVETARRKQRLKRGAGLVRQDAEPDQLLCAGASRSRRSARHSRSTRATCRQVCSRGPNWSNFATFLDVRWPNLRRSWASLWQRQRKIGRTPKPGSVESYVATTKKNSP